MKNIKILGIVAAIILLIVIGLFISKDSSNIKNTDELDEMTIEGEPIDTAIDFYEAWLSAAREVSTNPYTEGLPESEFLTSEVRDKILEAQSEFEQGISDPVLCQTELPNGLRSKVVLEQDYKSRILILGPRKSASAIAVVDLVGVDGIWKISKIDCDASESGPELGEFTFEQEGFLLKQSVQPPLDSNSWYLVYESNEVMGYTAVLNFNEASTCVSLESTPITCGDESFYEAMKVRVTGNMTEAGVDVVEVATVE